MTVLQIEHAISDFETWKRAFDADPVDRRGSGVLSYRVFRPVDDPAYVKVDLEFGDRDQAESFKAKLEQLWKSGRAAPALSGEGRARIVETVEEQVLETA